MAALLIYMAFMCLFANSAAQNCDKKLFKDMLFYCNFVHNVARQYLGCQTDVTVRSAVTRATSFQFDLIWENLNISDAHDIFRKVLETPPDSGSRILICDRGSDIAFAHRCDSYNVCLPHIQEIFNPSDVKRLEINKASNGNIFNTLNEFPMLEEVFIEENSRFDASKWVFSKLEMLKTLKLSSNQIKILPDETCSNLTQVEKLDLSTNEIEFISNYQFSVQPKLKVLDLSYNAITIVASNAFKDIPNLKFINLSINKLSFINESVFKHNILIKKIDIGNNGLEILPANLIHGLTKLEHFLCAGGNLVKIPKNFFKDSSVLSTVTFQANEIEIVPHNLFQHQLRIKSVDFSRNKLSEIPEFRFKNYLNFLFLSENNITNISESLNKEAPNLRQLHLNNNNIRELNDLDLKHFTNLNNLEVKRNKLTNIHLGDAGIIKIQNIHAEHNPIENFEINWSSFPILETLHLDYGKLKSFKLPRCIPSMQQNKISFFLTGNNLSMLDIQPLIYNEETVLTTTAKNKCPEMFISVTRNPLHCDCKIYPFYRYIKNKSRVKLNNFFAEDQLLCSTPALLQNASIINLSEDDFNNFSTNECPRPCTCGERCKDGKIFVNCTGLGMHQVPNKTPPNTEVLYFNRNHLRSMNSLNIEWWRNLTELHVDFNDLTNLEDWRIPSKLRYLSLKHNKMKHLPEEFLEFMKNQTDFQLFFGGNDDRCDCQSQDLKLFLNNHVGIVKDVETVLCKVDHNGSTTLFPLDKTPDEVLCPKHVILNRENATVLIVGLCASSGLLIVALLIYYTHRQLILSFLYVHCNDVFHACFDETDVDTDKTFDAFVAYSSSDRPIVMELIKKLEEQDPYFRLCIHERDWLPGRFINDNIVSSVNSSKRTIVVVSNTFIDSPWFRLELRAAIFRTSNDKMNKLIVILADKSTCLDGIDTDLKLVISKRTYLVWGERWFWEKLLYVMPRKSCLETHQQKYRCTTNHFESRSNLKLFELS